MKPPGAHVVVILYLPEDGDECPPHELVDVVGPLSEEVAEEYAASLRREPSDGRGQVEHALVRRLIAIGAAP